MTDPMRYGRSGPPFPIFNNALTATKRQLDTSIFSDGNVVLGSETSLKVTIRKILWAALARAVVRQLTEKNWHSNEQGNTLEH